MEPNSVFFLAGRYGNPENPYAIVPEFRNQVFNIVPPFTQIMDKMGNKLFIVQCQYLHK